MTKAGSALSSLPKFDEFLYSPIGADQNGMPLSVLSALARLDIDAWQEATELSRLSEESATQRLALLLQALPGAAASHETRTTAARLIGFLPHPVGAIGQATLRLKGTESDARALMVSMVFMSIVLVMGWIGANLEAAPVHVNHAAASSTAPPKAPPPISTN